MYSDLKPPNRLTMNTLRAAVLILALANSSHLRAQAGGARRDSAGVALISAPAADRPLGWRVTRAGTLGGAEAETLLPRLVPGAGIAALPDGRIVAADRANARVVFFHANGALEKTVGGRGGGPGEYQILGGVTTIHDTVVVYDIAAPHFTLLARDGRYLRTRPVPARPWDRFAFAGPRLVAVMSQSPANRLALRLVAVGSDTLELARQTHELRPVELPGCAATLPMTRFLLPPLAWAARGTVIAASSTEAYRINVFRNARLSMRISRAMSPRRVTEDDVRREAGDGMTMRGGTGCRVAPETLIRGRGAAEVVPSVSDLVYDPDGRLWVRRWAPRGTTALIDVFAADGSYIGTLPRGTAFPVLFTSANRYLAQTDADGVETVAIFDIAR